MNARKRDNIRGKITHVWRSRRFRGELRLLAGEMPVTGSDAVINGNLVALAGWFWSRAKIKFHRFPSVAALRLESEAGRWLVAAMGHAIFAARIFGHAFDDAILVPVHALQHLGIGIVVPL